MASNRLKIKLKSCYGIGMMEHEIPYTDEQNVAIIYAPNGVMKTSLTKVFKDISEGKDSVDVFYPNRNTERCIQFDDGEITKDDFYVFQNVEADGKEGVSTFLANPALKHRYDEIHKELAKEKQTLSKAIKKFSGSSDIEKEVTEAFRESVTDNFYDCLLRIIPLIPTDGSKLPEYTFKYNDVFDKAGLVKQFVEANQETIQRYFNAYTQLLSQSEFFSGGLDSFGTSQASTLLKSVADDRFFKASHKMLLKGDIELNGKQELKAKIDEEVSRIFNNEELQAIYTELERKLSSPKAMADFKEVIQRQPELIPLLTDYELFRRRTIAGYMQHFRAEFDSLCEVYLSKRDELKDIIYQANNDRSEWERVVNLFNARFFVPFVVKVENVSDVLLNEKSAALSFTYCDSATEEPVTPEQKTLMSEMSTGEVRAFNILQNIFVLEGLKSQGKDVLIILDDVADSFDYKNKYAIIEYLNDLRQNTHFRLLILTHNFDFYRTVVSRLNVCVHYFADKKADRSISIYQGIHQEDILKNRIIKNAHSDDAAFISLIPFVRNIIEYTEGDSDDYKLLTACLHDKPATSVITKLDIFHIFQRVINHLKDKPITGADTPYTDLLQQTSAAVLADPNEIELTNKLVLSIAIRHKTEQYIKFLLSEEQIQNLKHKNQTKELAELFRTTHPDKAQEYIIINKVLMLTSENIHLNNFMFEPLVDMSILHLKRLYDEVQGTLTVS